VSPTSTDTSCPTAPHWRRLLAGQLDPEERRRLERHLEACPACRQAVEGLRADTVESAAAGPQLETRLDPSPAPDSPSSSPLLRGTRINPPGFSFLSPPFEADEIGWLGIYRIRRVLGEGGMGIVFEAEDTHLQRRVALKVMKPEVAGNQASRQRFLQEARAAGGLSHDHIVTVYQVGLENDVPFLSMQYLYGETLEHRLQRVGRLPLPDLLRIGREVAAGLAAAHDKGIIHRDVKPANLWLEEVHAPPSSAAPRYRVKILDFGLARTVSAPRRLTASGFIVGTPHYLAPEQARGLHLDGRCDLYSLGVVLYRAACGSLPFDGGDPLSVLTALASNEPRPLSVLAPGLPAPVAALIHRLLAKDPASRPASGHEVAAEFEALERNLVLGEQTAGSPAYTAPSEPRSASSRVRPRPWPYWALALSVLAFVLVSAAVLRHHLAKRGSGPGGEPGDAGVPGEPIKLGVLFSSSGLLRDNGRSAIDATLLAIDELNEQGGVLDRRIQAVVADGKSDPEVFRAQAEKLIAHDDVIALVGCWTSACRRSVRPIVEEYHSLLLYPVQYEGLEQSPNIVYLGASPNQQILPTIRTAMGMLGRRRIYLLGTDSVYPRATNAMIRDVVETVRQARVVGEKYLAPGDLDVARAIEEIRESKADLVVDSLNGDTELSFPRKLRQAGIEAADTPILFFNIPEYELRGRNGKWVVGDYVACNYFESLDGAENAAFLRKFRERYGEDRVISDTMENCYVGVQLWARAVRKAGDPDPQRVREALKGMTMEAPAGTIRIDPRNQHTDNVMRLAHILPDGKVQFVLSPAPAQPPEPYPPSRTRAQWDRFLDNLYKGWGGHWEAAQH
jgi:urea transport system substrate-binding protein